MLFVRNAWSCAAVSSPSVSFFSIPLFNHPQDSGSLTCFVAVSNCPCNALFLYLDILSSDTSIFVGPSSRIFSSDTKRSNLSLLSPMYLCSHSLLHFVGLRMEGSVYCQQLPGFAIQFPQFIFSPLDNSCTISDY